MGTVGQGEVGSWYPVMGCSQASTMLDCGVSSPTWLAIIWSMLMPEWMMAPLEMCAPDKDCRSGRDEFPAL